MLKKGTDRGMRRWRAVAVLAVGVAIGTTMVATPAGAHLTTRLSHLFKHTDARYVNVGEERTTALFQERPGALPLSRSFRSSGRPLLITASGSGYGAASSQIGMTLSVDGIPRGDVRTFTNEASSHKAFVTNGIVVTGLAAGSHTLSLDALGGTSTDGNDFFTVTIEEISSALVLGPDGREPNNTDSAWNGVVCPSLGWVLSGNIAPAGDVDWNASCSTSGTFTFRVAGGVRMDVHPFSGGAAIATNVTSWTGPATSFYKFKIYGQANRAYTLYGTHSPSARSANRVEVPSR